MQARGIRSHNFIKLFHKILNSKDSLPQRVVESPKHFPRRQERMRGIKHIWIKHNIKHIWIKHYIKHTWIKHKTYLDKT